MCGGDEREAKRLWTRTDRHKAVSAGEAPRIVVLRPQFITEPWQLVHAMKDMRRQNGNPTLRELEERAHIDVKNKVSLLPKSTVGAVLQGRMPAKGLLLNFVRFCGNVPENRLQEWEDAWERAHAYRKGELHPEAAKVQHELTHVEEELRRTRGQLEQARAELSRAAYAARPGPTAVAPPRRPAKLVPPPARPKKTVFTHRSCATDTRSRAS